MPSVKKRIKISIRNSKRRPLSERFLDFLWAIDGRRGVYEYTPKYSLYRSATGWKRRLERFVGWAKPVQALETTKASPRVNKAQSSRWQRALGGLLTAVLLLPAPVFAFTWAMPGSGINTSWTAVGTPQNISSFGPVTGHRDWLSFTTIANSQDTSITLVRDFFPEAGNPNMSAQVRLADAGLQLQNGASMQLEVWTTVSGQSSPKSDIIGPLTLNGSQSVNNQFGTGPSLLTATRYTLHVSFSLTGAWTASATPVTLVSKFSD
jgi:hypothetical protein